MSGKELRKIIRIEIRSLRTISIIARLYRQCCKGTEVSKIDNVERNIISVIQGLLRTFGGVCH